MNLMGVVRAVVLTVGVIWITISTTFSQSLHQRVRGTVVDIDNKLPLIGATVVIAGTDPLVGTLTDFDGNFRLENVPIGRITLQLSYIGYESQIIPNIIVNSGKEVVLELKMQESAMRLGEIVVKANAIKGDAINEMSLVSARSISSEETNRYAGGFNDPSRIMSNFAGVTSSQDGGNDIIVRGNAPKYVQWRIEGLQITNPNHFADQGSAGGSTSMLNNNLLATSDFYTAAFSPEYGDALSGVYDVKLRTGNNEKLESILGVGLLGTDLTLEGPFKKGYAGSFLANYRYSTTGLISDLGLIDIGGIPKFQDATFKIVLPTKKFGTFSIFGLGGSSSLFFEDVDPSLWQTPGDNGMRPDINEDLEKKSYMVNSGLNHTLTIGKNSFINTAFSFSNEGIKDNIYESRMGKKYNPNGELLRDSVISRMVNYTSTIAKSTYRGELTLNTKLNPRNRIQIGTKYTLIDYENNQSQYVVDPADRFTLVSFDENISTLRNFLSWRGVVNEKLTVVAGVHNMNVLLNNKSTLEPRLGLNWSVSNTDLITVGYGQHSTMESIHHYFVKVRQPDGTVTQPNKDLGLLKAHHYVLGYEKRIGENIRAKVEMYYQDLYNLPVANSDTSYFATINEGLEFQYVDLVNKGKGKNYGVEFTFERFFHNNYYYLVNGSLYSSKYKSLEGVERNTQFNGNYLINILLGKEFGNRGRKQNQTLGINAKIFFGGGRKVIPLLRDADGNVAVDPSNNRYWDYKKAYDDKIEDVYQVVLSASYKWNKPKATHELFLNLDNVTNNKGKLSEFYDESKPNSIGYVTQFGLFPNLLYRIYF